MHWREYISALVLDKTTLWGFSEKNHLVSAFAEVTYCKKCTSYCFSSYNTGYNRYTILLHTLDLSIRSNGKSVKWIASLTWCNISLTNHYYAVIKKARNQLVSTFPLQHLLTFRKGSLTTNVQNILCCYKYIYIFFLSRRVSIECCRAAESWCFFFPSQFSNTFTVCSSHLQNFPYFDIYFDIIMMLFVVCNVSFCLV